MSSARINWRAIKSAYLYESPQPTVASLAEKYNCSHSAISKRCAREYWNDQRIERNAIVESKAVATEAERRAEVLAEMKIDSEQVIEKARLNHRLFQACVGALNSQVASAIKNNTIDAMDLDVWIKANKADADIAAKLHPQSLPRVIETSERRETDIDVITRNLREKYPDLKLPDAQA